MDLMKVKYLKDWNFLEAGKVYRQERVIAEQNIKDGICEEVHGITKQEIDFHLKAKGKEIPEGKPMPRGTRKKTTTKK